MSEQALKVLEQAMDLPADDRRWVTDRLVAADVPDPDTFHPDDVPADVQDEIMAEVERRMAEHEANPQPMRTADEVFARLFARIEERERSKQ